MTIQFSDQEIELIRNYLNKIKAGESQMEQPELQQKFSEWNTIFLLLRKLLAYGVYYIRQTDEEISYQELQTKTQKSNDMVRNVLVYLGQFEKLLETYIEHHSSQ